MVWNIVPAFFYVQVVLAFQHGKGKPPLEPKKGDNHRPILILGQPSVTPKKRNIFFTTC